MAVCPYCGENNAVEVGGLWVHQFPSRWISCNLKNQGHLNGGDPIAKREPRSETTRIEGESDLKQA
jgi:hypothetical protein